MLTPHSLKFSDRCVFSRLSLGHFSASFHSIVTARRRASRIEAPGRGQSGSSGCNGTRLVRFVKFVKQEKTGRPCWAERYGASREATRSAVLHQIATDAKDTGSSFHKNHVIRITLGAAPDSDGIPNGAARRTRQTSPWHLPCTVTYHSRAYVLWRPGDQILAVIASRG